MNANSVVNLTLSVTDQFSAVTTNISNNIARLINQFGQLAVSLVAPSKAIAALGINLFQFFGDIDARVRSIEAFKASLRGAGVDVDALAQSLQDFSKNKFSDTISTAFAPISSLAGGVSTTLGQTLSLVGVAAKGMSSQVVTALDTIDAGLLKIIEKAERLPARFAALSGGIANVAGSLSGVREPIAVFEALRDGVTKASLGIFSLVQELGLFGLGIQAIQQLVSTGPFAGLIGQNVELQQQLLATQATLAATNKILRNGFELTDATEAIKALGPTVAAAIKQLEKGSQELSNVTSRDLVPIFSIVAGQAGRIGASLSQATDLTLSFAAALGTLNIPLYQANQEIVSILNGTIDYNSRLAVSLGLTSQMVNQWKAQGILVQELTKRLQALRDGNKLAADSVGNIGSNIKDIFEIIQRTAGESFVLPIVLQLKEVYKFLNQNKEGITKYLRELTQYGATTAGAIKEAILAVAVSVEPIAKLIPQYLAKSIAQIATSFATAVKNTVAVLSPLINLFALLAQAATTAGGPVLALFLQFKTLQFAVGLLTGSFSLLFQIVEPIGSVLFLLTGRMNPLISSFTALGKTVDVGAAGFLLLGQRLNSIPGLAAKIASALPLIGGPLTAIIPSLSSLAIGLVALSAKFPFLKTAFDDLLAASPRLVTALGTLAGKAGLTGVSATLLAASASMQQYATTTAFTTVINEKFAVAATLAGQALRAQIIRTLSLVSVFAVVGVAVNELVLKNKELLNVLGAFGNFVKGLGVVIYAALASPITYLTAALVGLSVAIAANLLPSLAALKIALLDGILGAFKAVIPSILSYSAVMSKLGFVQAAVAARTFATSLASIGVAASSGTLTIGGLTASLGAMGVAAAVALAPITLVVAGILAIGKAFETSTSIVERGGSIVPDWILGIADKMEGLRGILSLLSPQIEILVNGLKALSSIKVEGAITPIIKDALEALRATDAVTKDLDASQKRTNAAKEKGIALTKEELALNKATISKANEEISRLDGQLSYLREQVTLARDDKTKLALQSTIQKLEDRRDKLEIAGKEESLKRINRQLDFAKKDIANIKDSKEKERYQAEIDDLEKRKQKLEAATVDGIQLKPILLTDFGNTAKAIADKVKAAQAILNTPYDAPALKKGLNDLIEGTQQQLESGAIDIEEAVKRFKKAASIGQLDPEDRIKAEKALTQAIKQEYEARASVYDALIAKQESRISAGRVGEIEGEREITRLKKEQYQEQLDSLDAQIRFEIALQEQRTGKQFAQIKNYSKAYKALIVEREKLQAAADSDALARQQKLLDKQLELVQRQTAKITDAITAAEVERNTAIQKLVNSGDITDTKAAELKVSNTRLRIAKELALEKTFQQELLLQEKPKDPAKADEYEKRVRASKIKTAQLTLQLAEEEERQQDATARVVQEAIERRTKATTNLITKQSREYQKQLELLNKVGDALAAQNKILEQRQSLTSAISGYLGSQLKLLADTSKTEEEKIKYERAAAVERLRFLRQEQDFARQKLELSIQQQRLQDAQALRQNQIDQLSAISEAKQSEADLKKKEADPNALPEELDALRLDLEAKQQKILIERQKGVTIGENATLNRRGEFVQRKELDLTQRSQTTQARLDLAKTLPPEQQEAAINRLRTEVYREIGGEKIAESLRNAFREIFVESRGISGPGFTNNPAGLNNTYAPDFRRLDPAYRAQESGVVNLKGNNQINTPASLTIPISTSTLEDQSSRLIKLLGDANATLVRIATTPAPVPPPMKVINQSFVRPSNGGLPR